MTTLQTILLVYIISLLINLMFSLQFWLAYRTATYKKLVILWLLTTLNFLIQGAVAESIFASLITFPTYILVAYYACSLLAETSSMPFNFRVFGVIYLISLIVSLLCYRMTDNFLLVALPLAIGVAAPQIFFAIIKLTKYRHSGTQFGNSFAILLLLNGAHFLDYPFLRPDPQMAIFGFGLVLIYSVGFGALLPSILSKYHTDRSDHLLEEIKKREKVEEDLALALEKAKHLTNVKSAFLANMSHEIRTPLTGIIGLNDLLMTTKLNAEQREYCHDIANASQKLRRIINNVLNLSKLESGTVVLEQEGFNISGLINEVNDHYHRHNKSNIDIQCFMEGDIPAAVIGDKGKLQQIAFNLIDNAIKYSQSDWVKFSLKYDFENGAMVLSVSDNGIGISPNVVNQLFNRFEQKHTKSDGVGLGLAIIEQLVVLMHGEISVVSDVGEGTTFTCRIPAQITDPIECEASLQMPMQNQSNKSSTHNLLVVDDNILNLRTVASLLKMAGYNCVLAENGAMARKLYEENNIDLILCDIQLPDVHGFDLIKHFRQLNPGIPIVAYSAFAFDEDVAAAANVGTTDYLRKPATFIEIKAKLEKYL